MCAVFGAPDADGAVAAYRQTEGGGGHNSVAPDICGPGITTTPGKCGLAYCSIFGRWGAENATTTVGRHPAAGAAVGRCRWWSDVILERFFHGGGPLL